MTLPIHIVTSTGLEHYSILYKQKEAFEKMGELDAFIDRCKSDFYIQNRYLEYFMDDIQLGVKYKLDEDDVEGFEIFKIQSDICSCLKYFGRV
jgi:hypothetical protein